MRTGAELVQATKPYAIEDRAKSWRLLIEVIAIWLALMTAIAWVPQWWAKLGLAFLLGLVQIRMFIFYHDYLHGALLRKSRLASAWFTVYGFFALAVRSVWKETHNYHHKHNAKIIGSAIGSFPMLTVGMWKGIEPGQRRMYLLTRHPLTIFFGYLPVFVLGMCIAPFKRAPKTHWGGPLALAFHIGLILVSAYFLGWWAALCMWVVSKIVTLGLGSYLFYAQHNFPEIRLHGRRDWEYTTAALESSSMFDMPKILHWFTGNIGYHHVHHLNHRIPFYRLPEAMAAIPELQNPGRTSWRLKDIKAGLDLAVWDPDQSRMITYAELHALEPQHGGT